MNGSIGERHISNKVVKLQSIRGQLTWNAELYPPLFHLQQWSGNGSSALFINSKKQQDEYDWYNATQPTLVICRFVYFQILVLNASVERIRLIIAISIEPHNHDIFLIWYIQPSRQVVSPLNRSLLRSIMTVHEEQFFYQLISQYDSFCCFKTAIFAKHAMSVVQLSNLVFELS